jgi:hypothetical protein
LVTVRAPGAGLLIVVGKWLQEVGNDGSTGSKEYRIRGFVTDFVPSGVVILTFSKEITSGGGMLLVAQSQ